MHAHREQLWVGGRQTIAGTARQMRIVLRSHPRTSKSSVLFQQHHPLELLYDHYALSAITAQLAVSLSLVPLLPSIRFATSFILLTECRVHQQQTLVLGIGSLQRQCVGVGCTLEQLNTHLIIQPNSLAINTGHDQICKRRVGLVERRLQPRAWRSTCHDRVCAGY